jgi:HAD superfamily hydrolase (TIGR01549 family)
MPTNTILLDAGGVILNEANHELRVKEIMAELICDITPDYHFEQYDRDLQEAVASFCPKAYDFVIWKNCGGNLNRYYHLRKEFRRRYRANAPALVLMDGADKVIQVLAKKYKLLLAGQYGEEIMHLFEGYSLVDCFYNALTQDDFDITKPDPRYLERIIQKGNADPHQCVMVGDRIDKDVIPAKMLGMKTVLARNGLHKNQVPRIPDEMPDVEIRDIRELPEAIEKI